MSNARTFLASAATALTLASSAQAITYTLDVTAGNATAKGFIETDGTLGTIAVSNFVDLSVTLTAPNFPGPTSTTVTLSNAYQVLLGFGGQLFATPNDIIFDSGTHGYFLIQGGSFPNFTNLCFEGVFSPCASAGAQTVSIGIPITGNVAPLTGKVVIASVEAAPVPLPSSLPLGLVGMAALGVLARRKAKLAH